MANYSHSLMQLLVPPASALASVFSTDYKCFEILSCIDKIMPLREGTTLSCSELLERGE